MRFASGVNKNTDYFSVVSIMLLALVAAGNLLSKIYLTLRGNQCLACGMGCFADVIHRFLDLKNPLLDVLLVGNIRGVNVLLFTQPSHQTISTDVDVVVGKAFRKFAKVHAVD